MLFSKSPSKTLSSSLQASSMAPPRRDTGKAKMDAGSSNPDHDSDTEITPRTVKSKRLLFNFSTRPLTPPKYGNLDSFPSSSFKFHSLLTFQGIRNFIEDSGYVYPDLVKEFYANLEITRDFSVTSLVKNIEILLILEEFGVCLGIPSTGVHLKHNFVCAMTQFTNYEKWKFYFSISHLSKQEITIKSTGSNCVHVYSSTLSISDRMLHYLIAYILLSKHSNHSQVSDIDLQLIYAIKKCISVYWALLIIYNMSHQKRLKGGLPYGREISKFLEYSEVDFKREPRLVMASKTSEISAKAASKNMGIFKDVDGIYKHIEQAPSSSNVAPTLALALIPIRKGGCNNEFLYNKICSIEANLTTHINTRYDNLRQELLTAISNSNQTHYKSEEDLEEDDNA